MIRSHDTGQQITQRHDATISFFKILAYIHVHVRMVGRTDGSTGSYLTTKIDWWITKYQGVGFCLNTFCRQEPKDNFHCSLLQCSKAEWVFIQHCRGHSTIQLLHHHYLYCTVSLKNEGGEREGGEHWEQTQLYMYMIVWSKIINCNAILTPVIQPLKLQCIKFVTFSFSRK